MTVKKIMQITVEKNLDFNGITLLSFKEMKLLSNKDKIIETSWWLRSPGDDADYAVLVRSSGAVHCSGFDVNYHEGVRPALKISNLSSSDLSIKDKFKLAGHTWTIISDEYALCDDIIGEYCFRKDWQAEDANDYEKSDIKKWLEKWYEENII